MDIISEMWGTLVIIVTDHQPPPATPITSFTELVLL